MARTARLIRSRARLPEFRSGAERPRADCWVGFGIGRGYLARPSGSRNHGLNSRGRARRRFAPIRERIPERSSRHTGTHARFGEGVADREDEEISHLRGLKDPGCAALWVLGRALVRSRGSRRCRRAPRMGSPTERSATRSAHADRAGTQCSQMRRERSGDLEGDRPEVGVGMAGRPGWSLRFASASLAGGMP